VDRYAEEHFPEPLAVVRRLRERGHESYFAGGYFRDRFLGRRPNDVDVATSARPDEVRGAFARTIPVGEQFGIIVVQLGQHRVEVATFREDDRYEDGRRPTSVRFSTAEADARRRDFTINGVLWDPLAAESRDFVGGRDDLVRGVVRAIGTPDARFDEDKLRILRAPRFAARLGFAIEPATFEAARRRAREVAIVSSERIRDELVKMLEDPSRARAIDLVVALGLAPVVLEELDPPTLAAGRAVLAELPRRKLARELTWAALLSGAPESAAQVLLERLRSSNDERANVAALVRDLPRVERAHDLRLAEQKRLLLGAKASLLLELARARALATTGDLEGVRFAAARRRVFLDEEGVTAVGAPPLLRGNDLRELGLKPGPRYKELLELAELARLEGRARTKDELVDLIRAERPDFFEPPRS
jgi:poly(A) polymerase